MTRILIVDDHPVVRSGMEAMLRVEKDFKTVAAVASGEEALDFFNKNGAVDLVIMDIRMTGIDGIETTRRIRAKFPDVSVLLLAGMPLRAELEEAKKAGAKGYLPKSTSWKNLVHAIRCAASPDSAFLEEGFAEARIGPLSPRETEILKYLAIGKTHDEIAIITSISVTTVKSHVKNILLKLDCPNGPAAVNRAYELGILRP